MARRNPNKHAIVCGAFRKHLPSNHSHTASGLAGSYYAYPPITGWLGGLPEDNGWKPAKGR